MKTRKNSKLLILVLTLVLLIGSVFAVTASASEAETGDLYAVTINHADKIGIAFVVKATQAEIENGTVAVKYTWEGGEEQTATYHSAHSLDGYVYVVTDGVAAYDLTKTLTFTVYTNGVAGETGTYSVATFLYNKLYRDNIEAGAQRDVYETLIAYGAASQVLFNVDTENLVDDLDYVYSKNANVKFDGKSYVLGATSATATYSGSGNVEAWIINGEEIASTATTYDVTVDGVVSVDIKVQCVHVDADPKDHNCDICGANEFGTCADGNNDHNCDYCDAVLSTCADTDNDHYCDVCNDKLSDCVDAGKDHVCDICNGNVGGECADGNNDHNCDYCGDKLTDHADNNNDHDCDICGAEDVTECVDNNKDHTCDICGAAGAPCADANGDYRCDACGVICFNTNMTSGSNGVTISNPQSSESTATADTTNVLTTVNTDAKSATYTYGAYYSLVASPTDATNKVLSVSISKNGGGSGYLTNFIKITPTVEQEGGALLVLEADVYVEWINASKNAVHLAAYTDAYNGSTATGTSLTTGFQRVSITPTSAATADAAVSVNIGGQTTTATTLQWISVRYILDTVNNTYSVYYSTDGGETYTAVKDNAAPANTSRIADFADVTSMGIDSDTYGVSGQSYVDNVKVYRTGHLSFGNVELCRNSVDENSDHVCDICGAKSDCADENTDGKCDLCGADTYSADVTTGVNIYSFTATSNSDSTTVAQTSITTTDPYDSTSETLNKYGVRLFRTEDPDDAANTVLKSITNNNAKSNTGNNGNYSTLMFNAASTVDGGTIHVFEFDFRADYIAKGSSVSNFLHIIAMDEEGNRTYVNQTNGSTNYGLVYHASFTSATTNAFTFGISIPDIDESDDTTTYGENESVALLDSCKWYRIRLTLNQTTGDVYYDVSFDNGATWYLLCADGQNMGTGLASTDIAKLGFQFGHYGVGGTMYFDDVRYSVTDTLAERPTVLGNDAVEYAE